MALTAKKVYAILKRQISDMEAKLNSPVRYRGTVATADLLPLNPDIGDMYNIESKSVYGEAGMNVAWNGVVWDTMGAPIDMSLYIKSSELADWVKQQNKPTYTAEEVGALPDTTVIPSKTSELQNDSGFLTKIPDNYLSGTDKTLNVSGKAADAKATGDKITELSADISNKLNKNQGSENSGKIAGINESGDIVPMFPVSVDYNEETNCLEFGSDQKMELNKGINLDNTLTKTGYAADAGAVGKITDSLKEDLDNVEKTTICKNIFGGVPNVYYPCNIPSGTYVTVSTEDGSNFEVGTTFNLYSSDKTRKDYWNLGNQSNRTIKTNADISYVTLSKAANANVQIEIGDKSTKYQEYFLDVKMLNKKLDNIGEDDIVNALINRAKIICGYVEKNTINGFLNNLDGSIKLDNTASQVTGFVKVIPNEILLYSGKGSTSVANVCFYDKKFAFISSVNSLEYGTFEINVPSEAVYARFASRANEDGEIAELIVNIKTKPMYKNNLTGKKWYACGDSFTEGAYIFDDLKLVDRWLEDGKYAGKLKSYPYYIGNRTNCDIYNIALSGSTLAYVSSEPKEYSFSSDYGTEEPPYNNYKSVPIDADYITLWFGINDNGYSVPIGNDDDTINTTFKGAYNIVLKYFVENCKKAKIGIIVSNNMPAAYVDATIKMANRWGIKYLDLNSDEVPLMQATLRNVCDEAKANAINKFAISQSNMHPNYYAHEFESKFIEHWLLSL